MSTYEIKLVSDNILKISFAAPAQNDQIVKDVNNQLKQMIENGELLGGELLKVNGPASLPVAMVIAHHVGHLYQAIACFDPKLAKYVVSIAHGDKYSIGDLIS
ncbi:MAG: CRISPR-associated protein [bacterium]|nr:MAG: CRISPR-associated protein [bacterium]